MNAFVTQKPLQIQTNQYARTELKKAVTCKILQK